ncbi:MAG: UTRA domain-containing protein, partial [Alcaligenaceae bacterium]|nr:UTRA domain-containing protein [Alcaligenaceae bacterium]
IYIKRFMNLGNRPTVIDEIWLPADVFKGLSADVLIQNKGPLYGLFETKFGVSMIRAEEKVKAVAASTQLADFLKVPAGFPLLQVERVSYTYGDRPMEIRRGFYLTDHYHYRNSLN